MLKLHIIIILFYQPLVNKVIIYANRDNNLYEVYVLLTRRLHVAWLSVLEGFTELIDIRCRHLDSVLWRNLRVYACIFQTHRASRSLFATRRSSTTASPRSSASRLGIRLPTSTSGGLVAGASRHVTAAIDTRSSRSRTEPCYASSRSVRAVTTASSSVWPRTGSATPPLPRPPCKSTPRDLVRLPLFSVVHYIRDKTFRRQWKRYEAFDL